MNTRFNLHLLRAFLAFGVCLLAPSADGANFYVRPSSSGAANGSDWNNAWSISDISWGKVKGGDSLWLAGGTYSSGLAVGASGETGNPIKIRRVLASDAVAVSAAGWKGSFDSQVKLPGGNGIDIQSASHIVVDGRNAYGILITIPKTGGLGITCGATGITNGDLQFHYIDVLGPYGSAANPVTSEAIGCKISPSTSTLSNVLLSHCRIRGVGVGVHCLASNVTVEYCYLADIASDDGEEHPDVLYCYPSPEMTWRYNTIVNCSVDGVFFEYGGAVNFRFYGNLYYNTPNHQIYFKGPETYGPIFIYNNTFHAPSDASYGYLTASNGQVAAGSEVYNNIFFNVSNSLSGLPGVKCDYNAYNYTRLNGYPWPSQEKHSFTFSGSPFVNLGKGDAQPPGGNFKLNSAATSTFRRGLALASDGYLNKDMSGALRGGLGSWDIGAYGTGGEKPPTAD